MNKTIKTYIVFLVLLFIAVIAIEFSKPKPVNWTHSFNENHKIPYGTYIFYNELKQLFPETNINDITISPYEYFDGFYNWEDSTYTTSGTYLHIDDYVDIDDVSAQELLDFASHGNDVFISSNHIPKKFQDSLSIALDHDYSITGHAKISLANPQFQKDSVIIEKGLSNVYFSKLDSSTTTVLGYQKFDLNTRINFIKVNHEYGNIYLHLQPIAFTNYFLLKKDNKKYTEALLAYLKDDTIFYGSKNKASKTLGSSPLRFILSQPALRWGLYLALITLFTFIIFNAKRKQRIVKVIKPLENTTVAFTKTIGNLYYETKDHKTITDKKIAYFLEFIRRTYYMDTQVLDEKFVKNLSLKTGKDFNKTKKTINLIVHLKAKQFCNEDDLLQLNKTIEDFHTT